MFALLVFKRRRWMRSRKLAEKYVGHARLLLPSVDPADVCTAISLLDAALKLSPQWEKALELKARALLSLRRYKDVANMLYDYIPSLKSNIFTPPESPICGKEKAQLLTNYLLEEKSKRKSISKFVTLAKLKKIWSSGFSRRNERNEWRYHVLGQACCHLGMMEDAMILLQSGKKAATAAFRRESISMGEDTFCSDAFAGPESDFVTNLLGNIKFLLRRRSAALAAMEAGLYPEAVRHFTKILDGRRGTPQGFIAECYLHRSLAFKASGRIPDAIADCNRTLTLDPTNVEALSTRASLYEMVRCFYESLQDLKQLRVLYEALSIQQKLPLTGWRLSQNSGYVDVASTLHQLDLKINAVKQRLESRYIIDYHTILGLSSGCTKNEVERAHLLICLKHRPDKAAHFIDRCEFVDDRDFDTVKEEAKVAAVKLFRLIQNAHTGIMNSLLDEEIEKRKKAVREAVASDLALDSANSCPVESLEKYLFDKCMENFKGAWADTGSRLPTTVRNENISHLVETFEKERHDIVILEALPSAVQQCSNCGLAHPSCGSLSDESSSIPASPRICVNERHSERIQHPVDLDISPQAKSTGQHSASNPFIPLLLRNSSAVPNDLAATGCGSDDSENSSLATRREMLAVEVQLAKVLSPTTWLNPTENWGFQTHKPMTVQVT